MAAVFWTLRIGLSAALAIAGADKFFHFVTNWGRYLADPIAERFDVCAHAFMHFVGCFELLVALCVAMKPRVGSWIALAWLASVTLNVVADVRAPAMLAAGIALGAAAFVLARMSVVYDPCACVKMPCRCRR